MALQEERWWGMTDLHTAAKLALEALIAATPVKAKDPQLQADAIAALREALAQERSSDEQPAQQEPLTPDQVFAIADQHPVEGFDPEIMAFVRAIESAHGIKGGA